MLSASRVAVYLRDSEEPPHRCGVNLGEANLRGDIQRNRSVGFIVASGWQRILSLIYLPT